MAGGRRVSISGNFQNQGATTHTAVSAVATAYPTLSRHRRVFVAPTNQLGSLLSVYPAVSPYDPRVHRAGYISYSSTAVHHSSCVVPKVPPQVFLWKFLVGSILLSMLYTAVISLGFCQSKTNRQHTAQRESWEESKSRTIKRAAGEGTRSR